MPRDPRPIAAKDFRRWAWMTFLLAAGLFIAALVLPACNAEDRYETLSFFFDGVPDPNAPAPAPGRGPAGQETTGAGGTPLVVYAHKPYAENKCDDCHAGGPSAKFDDFKRLPSDTCLKCHEGVPTQFPVMHGPVATAECLWCHDPHESTHKGILRSPSPQVCTQCHARELLDPHQPEHMDDKRSCLDCHNAHGGQKRGLLHDDWAAAPGATTPDTKTGATTPPAGGAP